MFYILPGDRLMFTLMPTIFGVDNSLTRPLLGLMAFVVVSLLTYKPLS
ncbi:MULTISPECIES: hypothetical protein [Cyanophyceae]|uniref:Uncharacterized protein n=1 Tax=Leptolyngbya subtilissima DQ-A4 TaxID=2933933 RepID=A0ABV0K3B8_9CYAN|nr:hypothetical protein [Nodosilinea sp. FACHB-141]